MSRSPSPHHWLTQLHCTGSQLGLKELTYYKAKAGLINLQPRGVIRHRLSGQYLAPQKGRGMEFAEVRHYQQGDDIRAIDWRVTARTGKTHTKLYQEEKERPVFIMADFSPSMLFGSKLLFKSVQGAHLAALIAWQASLRGDKIGGLVFDAQKHSEFRPRGRDNGVLHFFHGLIEHHQRALTQLDAANSTNAFSHLPLSAQLRRLNQLARPGSLVYLISDFSQLDEKSTRELQQLSRHCEVVAACIDDPFEQRLPAYSHAIGAQTHHGQINLALNSHAFRKQYQQHANAHQQHRQSVLGRFCHSVITLSAATPLEQQLKARGNSHAR